MRQLSLLLLALSLLSATPISEVPFHDSQKQLSKVDRLYYTCKIWGFLKYYHPLVGRGAYNWDEKLQSVLSRTSDIQSYEGFSTYMSRWINAMGPLTPCKSCNQRSTYEVFRENFDLSWTQSNVFSAELKKVLKNTENNRYQGDHHYFGEGKAQQFEPENEQPDYDFIWKEENQRLLPLFRYWNYIEYFAPYKYLTDQSWDDVLREMIPKFLEAETKLDLHLAILELMVKVDDGHVGFTSTLIEEMPYFNYLPVRLEMMEGQVVVTEIIDAQKARAADLQVGDILAKVNNESVRDLHNSHKKYIWGSNEAAKDRSISYTLFMFLKDNAQVTLERGGSTRTTNVTLYKRVSDLSYNKIPGEKWTILSDSITFKVTSYDSLGNEVLTDSVGHVQLGYVNMGDLTTGEVDPMMGELMDKSAIIFDIRNSPQGTYRAIAKYLNPTSETFASIVRPDLSYPGRFVWKGERTCGEENPDYYKGKVILLVDEQTQNHAEFTCMCLQTAPNTLTVGRQTAGANSSISRLRIIQRLYTSLSGIGIYYPDGRATQRVGITPDMTVRATLAGVQAGQDEVLDKAVEVVLKEIEEAEIARLEEVARLREIARLEELARQQQMMDSLLMDSLQMNRLQMDSLQVNPLETDSLKTEEGGPDKN